MERRERKRQVQPTALLCQILNEAVHFLHILENRIKIADETAARGLCLPIGQRYFHSPGLLVTLVCQTQPCFFSRERSKLLDRYFPPFLLVLLQDQITMSFFPHCYYNSLIYLTVFVIALFLQVIRFAFEFNVKRKIKNCPFERLI